MNEKVVIQKRMILLGSILGTLLIVVALMLDNQLEHPGILPSLCINLGTSIGLASFLFFLERSFLQTTIEQVTDIVETVNPPTPSGKFAIDILPTATDRGQQPKILVRITDPLGDNMTKWSVTLTSPRGKTETLDATWPGAGKIFRARFPINEPLSGKWSVVATQNGKYQHPSSAIL